MHPILRSLLFGVCSLFLLSGCGSSSYSSSRGTVSLTSSGGGSTGGLPTGSPISAAGGPTGSTNSIVATKSVSGTVSVEVGAKQTVGITFASSDGSAISGFGISGTLAALPAGWGGPGSFTCASVSTGSGCVLNLIYAPTAVGGSTFTLDYVFVDNATVPSTGGSVTIAYAATTHNNIVAAASPTGQINAVAGQGNQSISLSFTTDDGNSATNLTVTTDLTALPPGWSSTATSFSCAIISRGNGCQLPLTYTPTPSARGTLTMEYSYADGTGVTRNGAVNIPYSPSANNDIVATVSPSGEVNAIQKAGGRSVAVTFTTDDGKPATSLYLTTGLAALPAGWSSASKSFACSSVSTGNGCQLRLTYAPAALTSGTLILEYAFTDGAGKAKTGSLNVGYAATTDDNAVATASPTGQINAVAPAGLQPVSVTFTTDDGRPGTALQLTSNLSALPAGWSSTAASFSCSGFGSGNACQLPLAYRPGAADSGTLGLSYTYVNNAGGSKSGTFNIAYRATTDDNVVGTPQSTPLGVAVGTTTTVIVDFTTDDANLASGLLVTPLDFASLPIDWRSVSSSFACLTVSTGSTCQLTLTYTPNVVENNTLSLGYSYADNSGTAKTGMVSIPYSSM